MSLYSYLSRNKRLFITIIILANLSFILNVSYILYFKEALFDTTKQPTIESKEINRIEIREGSWEWSDRTWEFGHNTKLRISKAEDIKRFCIVVESSHAKYIDNIRGNFWLYIYFINQEGESLAIVLKRNYQGEVFFEYEDNTYEGQQLSDLLKDLSK